MSPSHLSISLASIRLADDIREVIDHELREALSLHGRRPALLDVTVASEHGHDRVTLHIHAVLRPAGSPLPEDPGVLRYELP